MLKSLLLPEKEEDRIHRTTIIEATAVKAVVNTLINRVDPLIDIRNPVVDRTMIRMIIIRVVDIQRKADTNIKNHDRDLDQGLSHHILHHHRKGVVKATLLV